MDKNEQSLIIEEFKKEMHDRNFSKATLIADDLEIKKIKDNNLLNLIADAYEVNHQYQAAKKVLLSAYENTNAGRHLAYRLCLIAVKTKEFDEAEEFYQDFVDIAPRDTRRYILRYRISKAKDEPKEKLIEILEEYVNIDMEEQWAYELAKLYHTIGDEEKCIDMCDEISLWFAKGTYVVKALELKQLHTKLAPSQEEVYRVNKEKSRDIKEVKIGKIKAEETKKEEVEEDERQDEIPKKKRYYEPEEIKAEHKKNNDIAGVESILKQLQERGILKAETVSEAVNIIENTSEPLKEEPIEKVKEEPIEPLKEETIETLEEEPEELIQDELKAINEETVSEEVEEVNQEVVSEEVEEVNEEIISEELEETTEIPSVKKEKIVEELVKEPMEEPVELEEIIDFDLPLIEEVEENQKVNNETNRIPNVGKTKIIPQKDIKEAIKKDEEITIPKNISEEKIPVPKAEELDKLNVPVFDLSFEGVSLDSENQTSQKEIYKNIVAKSELGNFTDELPDQKEINNAIKKAEENLGEKADKTFNPKAKTEATKEKEQVTTFTKPEIQKEEQAIITPSKENTRDLHIVEEKTVQVEILAGETVDKPFYAIPKEEPSLDDEPIILEKPDISIVQDELNKETRGN